MEDTIPQPLPKPRYPIVNAFPVATLAPYVGTSAEALAWCGANKVETIEDLRRKMRPQGNAKQSKCPEAFRAEFERLLDPPGIPADWPLHPDVDERVLQQLAHEQSMNSLIGYVTWRSKDPWAALLYLIHFEEDFMQYKGVGPTKLPLVLAWRDEMRKRHERPAEALGREVLKRKEWNYPRAVEPVLPDRFAPLWKSAADRGAQGAIGTIRYAGRAADGANHICLDTATMSYTMRWPDWAFALAKDALLSDRRLFVMARGEPFGANLLEVHLLEP